MIDISRLLCGSLSPDGPLAVGDSFGHRLRYGRRNHPTVPLSVRKPIVVWNMTPQCNLHCHHCYYSARSTPSSEELSTAEGLGLIDDLARFDTPVLLFSGGEPLMRPDLMELGRYAVEKGLRTVISTNGTLIDRQTAGLVRAAGFSYVGISLDGIGPTNDRFRGKPGAYEAALAGIRHCVEAGVKVGLRLTLNRNNVRELPMILDTLEEEGIRRACFYHLVYAGRGKRIQGDDLTPAESRAAMGLLMNRAEDCAARGVPLEILTVDNHADGPYLYLRLLKRDPERARAALELLRANGGNLSGIAIAAIDHAGNVHADQFWQHVSFGNVRRRPFGEIWTDTGHPLMAALKDRQGYLKGRCAACRFLEICNGNFRVRAEAVYGDLWAPDPACYLTEDEIRAG